MTIRGRRWAWDRVGSWAPVALLLLGAGVLAEGCATSDLNECPSGRVCPTGMTCAAAQDVCIKDRCGNGVLDADELCDDGNIADEDGCSADCKSGEVCGNGTNDPGEVCDDGNNVDGDGCSADCMSRERCGNQIVDSGEACD